jgi:hypothetical protein
MFSTNSSNGNELSTPLIGNRPQHESDEEQGLPCSSLMLATVYEDDDDESCRQKAAEDDSQWFNNFVVLIVLPALLFIQFGMAFTDTRVQGTTGLQWSVVNSNIIMFVITAALYRQAVQDFQMTCSIALLLLPEILMDAVLGLVLCGQVLPAFLLLLCSMLCLACFVVANSIRVLVVEKLCDEESVPDELHDEFGVGFEPLWAL